MALDVLCSLSVGLLALFEQAHALLAALVAYSAAYLVFTLGGPGQP